MTLSGWAAPEARRHAEAAWALTQSFTDAAQSMRILWVLYVHHLNLGHIRESFNWAAELIRLGESTRSEDMSLTGYMAAVMSHYWSGNFEEVERQADLIDARYDSVRHRGVADLTTFDPREVGLSYRARAQMALGFLDQALETAQRAVAHARQRGHPADVCYALLHTGIVQGELGDTTQHAASVAELERLALDHGLSFYVDVVAPMQHARLALDSSLLQDAEAGFRYAIDQWRRAGEGIALPGLYALHASSAALLGKHELSISSLDEALRQIAIPGWEERCHEAAVLGTKGWVLSLTGDVMGAERHYLASLDVARQQQAKFFELRTAARYARLLKDQNRATEALAVLEPVYGWFTEGFDTKDLKEARTLLEELS
jgi:tetratricopeptide (TPR) repeat protein